MYQTRPQKRADCKGKQRPCPWISCRHHMIWALPPEIWKQTDSSILKTLFSLPETCVLDVADRPQAPTLAEIGSLLGVTRERIRQIQSGNGINGTLGFITQIKTPQVIRYFEGFEDY